MSLYIALYKLANKIIVTYLLCLLLVALCIGFSEIFHVSIFNSEIVSTLFFSCSAIHNLSCEINPGKKSFSKFLQQLLLIFTIQ